MANTKEYEWADITLFLGGEDITGIRAVKYGSKGEKEAIYAKGRNPHSIQGGNNSHEGELEVMQSTLEKLRQAGGGSILGLSLDAEVSYGNPAEGDAIITDRIEGISFTEDMKDIKQGDKFMPIKLPFICLNIKNQV